MLEGRIIKSLAGFYYVENEGRVYSTKARGKFRNKNTMKAIFKRLSLERICWRDRLLQI